MERPPVEIVDDDAGNGGGGSGCDIRDGTEQPHRKPPSVVRENDQQNRLDERQYYTCPDRLDDPGEDQDAEVR